jgi:autoinducer-2 kinase
VGYAALERLASSVPPGSGGLLAEHVPVDAWTLARWRPPFPQHPGPGAPARLGAHVRAIEEAAAYSARRSATLLTELLGTPPREVILTGGAARSTLWPQILADVLGLPIHVPGVSESAAAGAAALAGLAIGVRPGAATPADPSPPSAPLAVPTSGQAHICDRHYAQWIRRADPPMLARRAGGHTGP